MGRAGRGAPDLPAHLGVGVPSSRSVIRVGSQPVYSPCLARSHMQPHTVTQLPSLTAARTAVRTIQPLATHRTREDSYSYPMSPSPTVIALRSAHARTHTHACARTHPRTHAHTAVTHSHSLKRGHMQPQPLTPSHTQA